jgi:hypothetical protein
MRFAFFFLVTLLAGISYGPLQWTPLFLSLKKKANRIVKNGMIVNVRCAHAS